MTQLLVLELDDGDIEERLLLLLHVYVVQGGAAWSPHCTLHCSLSLTKHTEGVSQQMELELPVRMKFHYYV